MNLRRKDIIGLPVFTQSGQALGKVTDLEIDSETQKILRYHARCEKIIKEIIAKELIISAEQVISIDREKMIVDDNITKEKKQTYEPEVVPV